LNAFT
jgi:hypothetical protein